MNPSATIAATFWGMVTVQTIGSVDPLHGPRKMPSPKQYVAIVALWSIFHLAEGTRWARHAAGLSVLVAVTAMVSGPFGPRLLAFLNLVGSSFSLAPASTQAAAGPSSSAAAPDSSGGETA